MITEVLEDLYQRDLEKLKIEIGKYSTEAGLWKTTGEITNSAGNLTLHLIGNLKHFFGAVLGKDGFVRDRDLEFSDVGVPRETLISGIDQALASVKSTLAKLPDADLQAQYPIDVFGHPMATEYFLIHLATHLNYHLGQINYHRRLFGHG